MTESKLPLADRLDNASKFYETDEFAKAAALLRQQHEALVQCSTALNSARMIMKDRSARDLAAEIVAEANAAIAAAEGEQS